MKHKHKYRRSRLLVERNLQLSVIGYSALLSFVSIASVKFLEKILIGSGVDTLAPDQMPAWSWLMPPLSAITVAILAGFMVTHRFAGPVVRLKNHMKAIVEGKNPPPVRLRDGDFLSDLAQHYNDALAHLGYQPSARGEDTNETKESSDAETKSARGA